MSEQQSSEAVTPPHGPAWEIGEELPPRPRRRILRPLPVALAGVLVTACGFIGGVLVEKGQGATTAAAATGVAGARSSRLAAFGRLGASGAAGGGGAAGATAGQVSFVQGDTLYVQDAEGDTVKVLAGAGTAVTRTVSSSARAIHPGETVIVTGSRQGGAVDAESIRVGSAAGGLGGAFGAGGASSASGAGGGTQALFGPGG